MPRNKRLEIPGAIYHVINRGIDNNKIFQDNIDRKEFLRRLEQGLKDTNCKCYGWALMPNHFHLVIMTGQKPLSDLMRKLLTGYAVYYNKRHERKGFLYQNRYKSILCQQDVYLLELVRYIHLNPLRARIVKNMNELDNYPWTGHKILLNNQKVDWQEKDKVLSQFSEKRSDAIKRYREFMIDGLAMGKREDLVGGGLRRSAGGWKGVYQLQKGREYWKSDERILGDGDFVERVLKAAEEDIERREKLKRKGWNLESLINWICNLMSIKKEDLKKKGRDNKISDTKSLLVYFGIYDLNIRGNKLAQFLNISEQAVSKAKARGEIIAREKCLKLIS